jgi:hypothetical protein
MATRKTTAARCVDCGHEWRTSRKETPFPCPKCKRATGYVRPLKPSKFRNRKTEVDGITFDSRKEARRWQELRRLERDGEIRDLKRQVRYPLEVNGSLVCTYVADFTYEKPPWSSVGGILVTEDTKGKLTDVYRLKKRLMLAIHGVEVRET